MSTTQLRAAVWAAVGAVVVLFAFFALLGGIDPAEAGTLTLVVGVLAIAWLGHAWHRSRTTDVPRTVRPERERRGF